MSNEKLISEFLSLVSVDNFDDAYSKDIVDGKYFGMPLESIIAGEKKLLSEGKQKIAYFSMEYGLGTSFYNKFTTSRAIDPKNIIPENNVFSNYSLADYYFSLNMGNIIDLPIYSGGLGVLAGDTLKTMADYKLGAVGVGVLWRSGYFRQKFWFKYGQAPEKTQWDIFSYPGLIPLKNKIKITLKSEEVILRLWKYYAYSYKHDYAVPLILLDSNVEGNSPQLRLATDQLYRSGDVWIKIFQRVILGLGGIAALKELGYPIDIFHLNEGHAIFAFIGQARGLSDSGIEKLKSKFFYTCHTPVEAGHDKFSLNDLSQAVAKDDLDLLERYGKDKDGLINLTLLSMNIASWVNSVSRQHQKIMHLQFPRYKERIKSVTNGVHPYTWASQRFIRLFEKFPLLSPEFKSNPMILSKVIELKNSQEFRNELWLAHQANKEDFCNLFGKWKLKKDVLTICWARRMAAYKRPSMILYDIKRLVDIARKIGPLQIILAGKAHPNDNLGFTYVNEMLDKIDLLEDSYDVLKIIALENYDIAMAKGLVSSVDVWLNNPLPPFEASGTSGMKAILNGVVQVSTFDGWVAEAADKNIGVIFGFRPQENSLGNEQELHLEDDSEKLYGVLEDIAKLYYKTNQQGKTDISSGWIDMMINCIAAGGVFNTYRMLDEYKHNIWGVE